MKEEEFECAQELRRYARKWVHLRQSTLHEDVCIVTNSWSREQSLFFQNLHRAVSIRSAGGGVPRFRAVCVRSVMS